MSEIIREDELMGWDHGDLVRELVEAQKNIMVLRSHLEFVHQSLEMIADPSYVDGYETDRVVEVYRTWARAGLPAGSS